MKILAVVADSRGNNADWRRFLEPKLQQPAFSAPEVADEPEAALEICRERAASSLDCVLVAVGSDAVPVDFIAEIVNRRIAVVVVSAADSARAAIAALKAGASDFLLRENVTADALRDAIRQAIAAVAAAVPTAKTETEILRESEQRYRTLFNSIDAGFCVCEMILDDAGKPVDYRFLEINPKFEEHTGLRNSLGKTARELVPNLEPHWFEIYGRVALTGDPVRFVQGSDAMSRWFDVYAFRFGEPRELKFAILFNDITERRRLERERERFLAVGYDLQVINGTDGYFRWVNPAWEKTFGWTVAEMTTKPWREFVHPNDRGETLKEAESLYEGKEIFSFENRFLCKDGSYRWLNWRARTYTAENLIYAVANDVSERKEAEQNLVEAQNRLESSLTGANLGVWTYNVGSGEFWADERAKRMHGHEPNEVQTFEEAGRNVHPEDRERAQTVFAEAIKNRSKLQMENRILQFDGSVRWIASYAKFVQTADETSAGVFYGVVQDITERKQAEERLRESEEQLRNLADSIPQLAWMAEPDGFIFWYNRRWYEYTGTTFEQMQGWGWETVHDSEMLPKVVAGWQRSIATGEPFEMEFPLKGADGEFRWFLTRVNPLRDSAGKITRWFGTNTDVDESRRLRKQAEEANRAKDDFLAVLSHELRTPLNAMYGWSQILEKSNYNPAQTKQAIEIITRNARLQNALIEDLLDVSRIISGKMRLEIERASLASVVQSAVEAARPAAEKQRLSIEAELDPNADEMFGDKHRLQQIVSNLLTNAVKFTPAGGSVKVALKRSGDKAKLTIKDSGIGIAPELLPHVFDRFKQADASSKRRYSGLGLGLTIVKHLVELHGGSISAHSEGEGRGATFEIELPLAPPKITHADLKPGSESNGEIGLQEDAKPFAGMRILVVDDDADALDLMCFILERQGADAVCCNSARAALQELQNARFDLLISDLGMADMDGFDLIRAVRERENGNGARLPAIALTGYVSADDRERVFAAGFQTHLPKPVNLEKLSAAALDLAGK